jgi:hypothetical protein
LARRIREVLREMLFAKTKELLVSGGLRFGFLRINRGTRQGVNASSPLPVLYFEPFSGAVKSFAKSRLCRVARKSIAFADFFPRKALNTAKGNFAGQTVANGHYFIQEQGGFGAREIALRNLVFGFHVEGFLPQGFFSSCLADQPHVGAEQISSEIPHSRSTVLFRPDRF